MHILNQLKRPTFFVALALIVVAPWWQPTVNAQENWPQWRGPNLDNISESKGLPDVLDESTLAWKVEMPGPAGASPVAWGDNIFVTSADGNELVLMCVTTDGKLKWKKPLAGRDKKIRDRSNAASPSPLTDGKHVWVLSIGTLQCFDTEGQLVWKKDLEEDYGKFQIQFGMTSTPILHDDRLYVQLIHGPMRKKGTSTGWIVALNAKDGKEIWKHKRETDAIAENKHAYTSPTIYKGSGTPYLITHGGDFVIGHSLKDGSEAWRCGGFNPKGSSYNMYLRMVASPVCTKDMIVVPSAKNGPVYALKPDLEGDVTEQQDAKIWEIKKGTPDVATPLIHDGMVYLARENGVIIGLDAKNGEKLFEERVLSGKHRSSPVAGDGKIYLLGRKGEALVLKPGRELAIASESNLEEEITASPAIAGDMVIVRSYKHLFAFKKK